MMTSFYKNQKTSTQTPNPQPDCSQLQGKHSFSPQPGTSVQTQLLGFVTLPGRLENWYFKGGTAAEIHMDKVLSYAALMGRVGSREGTQGRALPTTKPRDRRKNFQ